MVSLKLDRPSAITMWDFSWLERRWPGAGYEDWSVALDELKERGYDSVRIDAYPHLVAVDAEREWDLLPCWNQQDWGSAALNRVRVQPNLNRFIRECRDREIKVALSTWFREDREDHRKLIFSPERHAQIWERTLATIDADGLLDAILYVNLCNEWPLDCWAPFFKNDIVNANPNHPFTDKSMDWMRRAIDAIRSAYPALPYCFSGFADEFCQANPDEVFFDLLEPHIWLANCTDFYDRVGYQYERFESIGYENVVRNAERIYRASPEHWQAKLRERIQALVQKTDHTGLPLVTTECWAIVNYKDWPLLDWGWVKELTAVGVEEAVSTGRWAAIATSNFCGPQFRGMWRDIDWHRRLTDIIHQGSLPERTKP